MDEFRVGGPVAIATIVAGLLRFTGFLFPVLVSPVLVWHIQAPASRPYALATWAQLVSVAVIFVVTLVNCPSIKLGGEIQITLTIIKIAAIVAVIVLGFAFARHDNSHAGVLGWICRQKLLKTQIIIG